MEPGEMEITHLAKPDQEGDLAPLFFYTKKYEEYFWGTGNNSHSRKKIQEWTERKKIFELKEPIILSNEKTLWLEDGVNVWIGDMQPPSKEKFVGKFEDLVK